MRGRAFGGSRFLKKLGDDFREKKGIPDPLMVLVLARNWTNPPCPLWLTENPTLAEVCKVLSIGASWTKDTVGNRVKERRRHRTHVHPIVVAKKSGAMSCLYRAEDSSKLPDSHGIAVLRSGTVLR